MEVQFEVSCKISAKDFREKCDLKNLSYFEVELTYNTNYNYSGIMCKLTNENLKDAVYSVIEDNYGSELKEILSVVSAGIFDNKILFDVALEFNFESLYLASDIHVLQILISQYKGNIEKISVKQNTKEDYRATFDISPLDTGFNDILAIIKEL